MKRIVGLLVAALAVGVAALGSREFDAERVRVTRQEARRAAETAAQRATDAVTAQVAELKLKADNASSNPRLGFALQGNVDERTLRDLWRTEEWWRPWRTEFKVYALAFSGVRLDVVEGVAANDINAEALIRHVRDRGESASEIITGRAGPYAAAATLVTVPGRERPVVLLLAKPIDQTILRKLVDKAGGAVSLASGSKSVLDAGPEAERALLRNAIAADPKQPLFEAADGTWAMMRGTLTPSLSLWAFASGGANAHDAESVAAERKLTLWAVATLGAGIALLLGFRRSSTSADRPAAANATSIDVLDSMRGTEPISFPAARDLNPLNLDREATQRTATIPPMTPRPAPGEMTFGRYTLLDRLGEGGMAELYTAMTYGAEGFRRKFVIKRLRPELARDPVVVDQFIDEANLASSMVHSNIVPVFDFGKVGEEYFLAQEYILGRDLARFNKRSLEVDGKPASYPTILYFASETLKALEYAHAKTNDAGVPLGIVHRDVSPTNIMISARGEVKLFDFGIVKAEGRMTKTQSGVVKGNVTFMSPEQARGGDIDARADLFSLGLVMFYAMTGRVLYSGQTTYELLVRAASGPSAQEHAQLQALPGPCGPLLRRALEAKPGDRFQTAHEFRDAIAPHIGAGGAELASLIQHLFADDFRAEEARFRAFSPSILGPPPGDAGAAEAPVIRRP